MAPGAGMGALKPETRARGWSCGAVHAGDHAARYRDDNLRCLNHLNPDALARLVAASEEDLTASISLRRDAAGRLSRITEGFSIAVDSLGQQQSLARALMDGGVGGRAFVQAASTETESPFLLVTPERHRLCRSHRGQDRRIDNCRPKPALRASRGGAAAARSGSVRPAGSKSGGSVCVHASAAAAETSEQTECRQ